MRRKRAFAYLLLELLIALTLVTLCLVPFIGIPSDVSREEIYSLQRVQLQHLGDNTCAMLKEQIYQKQISWEDLSQSHKKLYLEDSVSLPFKELAKQRFSRKCYLSSRKKKGPNGEEYRLLRLEVAFKKIPETLPFFSSQKKKEQIKPLRFVYKMVITQGGQIEPKNALINENNLQKKEN